MEQLAHTRLRVSTCLSAIELEPSGLPPAAILLVRRLADPARGALLNQPAAWEQATRDRLSLCLRRALRPALGPVPANAEAILFLDRAELLACFARDLLNGIAHLLWWWRAWFRTLPSSLYAAWSSGEVRHLPAALQLLARTQQAVAAVQLLTPQQAVLLLDAITTEFRLHPFQPTHLSSTPSPGSIDKPPHAPAPPLPPRQAPPAVPKPSPRSISEPIPPPPLFDPPVAPLLLLNVPVALPTEYAALLALALALERTPSLVRSPLFPAVLRQWLDTRTAPPQRPESPAEPPPPEPATVSSPPASSSSAAAPQPRVPPPRPAIAPPRAPQVPVSLVDHLIQFEFRAAVSQPAETTPSTTALEPPPLLPAASTPRHHPNSATHLPAAPPPTATPPPPLPPAASVTATPPPQPTLDGLPTELGGILFLIHVLPELDLDALLDESTGAWVLLEHLARSLLTPEHDPYLADQIWPLLADLDGRSPQQPLPPPSPAVAAVLPAVRRRLWAALQQPDDLVSSLLLRRGRLHATRSHLDLLMPLDAVTLPVRLAGLDCNPGWVPVLGRVIAFHYI